MTTDKRRISNSELATFRRCRRKWYLGTHRSLKKKEYEPGGALKIGTWVHQGMQPYYNAIKNGLDEHQARAAALMKLDAVRKAQPLDSEGNEFKDNLDGHRLANAIVLGYFDWAEETGYDADFKVVETEIPLQAESPVKGVDLIGKLDLLGMRKNAGVYRIRDFKTTASLTAPLKTLHLDRQMKLYHLLLLLTHPEWVTDGTEWVMMKKVLRTAKATPPFYSTYEIHHNEDELRLFWQQLYGEITTLLEVEARLEAGESHQVVCPPNPRPECSYDCPFLFVCGPMDDPRTDSEYLIGEYYEYHNSMSRYERDVEE